MAFQRRHLEGTSNAQSRKSSEEWGFALVSLLSLIPLLLTLTVALGGSIYILKKKSLAQSICLRAGIRLQQELRGNLVTLIKLNPKAKRLEARRSRAEKAFRVAIASGNPSLIAAAKANKSAVFLEQTVLKAEQFRLLTESARARSLHQQQLSQHLRNLAVKDLKVLRASQGLAVFPTSLSAITPQYQPVAQFTLAQQERYEFHIDLSPPFHLPIDVSRLIQPTRCSVSIEGDNQKWHVRIIAANVPLKPCSLC